MQRVREDRARATRPGRVVLTHPPVANSRFSRLGGNPAVAFSYNASEANAGWMVPRSSGKCLQSTIRVRAVVPRLRNTFARVTSSASS